jgi:sulfite exporter TauE/SafE
MGRMMTDLHWLAALCSADVTIRGGLLAGLFLAGAAGGVVHCAPMCGGFVLGQVSDRMARLNSLQMCESARIRNGLLVPYHLGRITTYAALGAVAAGSASVLRGAGWFTAVSAGLLLAAAGLFLYRALGRTGGGFDRAPAWWSRIIGRVTRHLPRGSWLGEASLGLALGFLPCGFLYAAITAAAATGRPWMGAAAMIAFGAGTAPNLMVVGIAGQAAGRRWTRFIAAAAPAVMALNAALLLVLAWQRMT